MTTLGRFTELTVDQMSPAQRAAADLLLKGSRGRIPPPYKIWLSSPELVHRIEGLGQFLLRESSLSPRENEIAILVTARHLHCAFVSAAHTRAARRVGLPEPVIEALNAGRDPALSDPRERTLYDLAAALPAGPPPAALHHQAIAALGEAGVSELSALLGYYTAVCFILNAHDVPAPPPD